MTSVFPVSAITETAGQVNVCLINLHHTIVFTLSERVVRHQIIKNNYPYSLSLI